jgi:ABC-type tungstate transport system permease subunit
MKAKSTSARRSLDPAKTVLAALGACLFLIGNLHAQSVSEIRIALIDSAPELLEIFHPKGNKFQGADANVVAQGTGDFVAQLTINYKGWVKNHNMKLEVLFANKGVASVRLLHDSNAFDGDTDAKSRQAAAAINRHASRYFQ